MPPTTHLYMNSFQCIQFKFGARFTARPVRSKLKEGQMWCNSLQFQFNYTCPHITPPTTFDVYHPKLSKIMVAPDAPVGRLPPPPLLPYHCPPPDRDLSDDGAQSQLSRRLWIVPIPYWGSILLRSDCRPTPTLSNAPNF
jgi:hypothetical protein